MALYSTTEHLKNIYLYKLVISMSLLYRIYSFSYNYPNVTRARVLLPKTDEKWLNIFFLLEIVSFVGPKMFLHLCDAHYAIILEEVVPIYIKKDSAENSVLITVFRICSSFL